MVRYAVWLPSSRPGEFEFLCSTQNHWTKSKNLALREAREAVEAYQEQFDPPLTREEAIEEIGEPVVYELHIKRIKL